MDTEVCKMWGSYARGPVDSPFGQRRASWRNGNHSFSIREVILFPSRMFWRKKRRKKIKKLKVFSRLVIRKNNWAFWNLLMLVWMDYNGHPIYCHFGFFFPNHLMSHFEVHEFKIQFIISVCQSIKVIVNFVLTTMLKMKQSNMSSLHLFRLI